MGHESLVYYIPRMKGLCRSVSTPDPDNCTANALYRKLKTNIPKNETALSHSQSLHSCICERFIYSHRQSASSMQQNRRTNNGNVSIAHRYMNVEILNEATRFYWNTVFVSNFRCSVLVHRPWDSSSVHGCALL